MVVNFPQGLGLDEECLRRYDVIDVVVVCYLPHDIVLEFRAAMEQPTRICLMNMRNPEPKK